LVIDCHTRELLGWHLARAGKTKTAEAALEQALIARYGTLGKVPVPFLLRSDNGLVFTSRSYTALVRSYGLTQEFITPHYPQQNGMVERVIRTLKEQCVHRHRFRPCCMPAASLATGLAVTHPATPSGAGHENTCGGIRFSSLTCADSDGSLQNLTKFFLKRKYFLK
jgi:putative transposase